MNHSSIKIDPTQRMTQCCLHITGTLAKNPFYIVSLGTMLHMCFCDNLVVYVFLLLMEKTKQNSITQFDSHKCLFGNHLVDKIKSN